MIHSVRFSSKLRTTKKSFDPWLRIHTFVLQISEIGQKHYLKSMEESKSKRSEEKDFFHVMVIILVSKLRRGIITSEGYLVGVLRTGARKPDLVDETDSAVSSRRMLLNTNQSTPQLVTVFGESTQFIGDSFRMLAEHFDLSLSSEGFFNE
ncbi:hypothetical protein CDAR_262671 [Caerostris darwini]|uniref:Uncharacterized protein n=1 Tax=Caerostris darwini TaxID=1538125 RepID=A0AAV4TGV7_9ARAC|nr:hypothetical protein CDAR_262671 [Caerostris darwini]